MEENTIARRTKGIFRPLETSNINQEMMKTEYKEWIREAIVEKIAIFDIEFGKKNSEKNKFRWQ